MTCWLGKFVSATSLLPKYTCDQRDAWLWFGYCRHDCCMLYVVAVAVAAVIAVAVAVAVAISKMYL